MFSQWDSSFNKPNYLGVLDDEYIIYIYTYANIIKRKDLVVCIE